MTITRSLYSEIVNKAIDIKKASYEKDDLKIVKDVFEEYQNQLDNLTENEKSELNFQVVYSLINAFR